ncbi:hypothetical protein LZ30DRAFT_749646 [Colletotrichum cereale]|nr:hypothetical protein LZ30DRAFT_749646 [Colletotrichum cereale]
MALAVDTPLVAPSGRVFVNEGDGNVAFGAAEPSWQDWSTTQSNPSGESTRTPNDRIINFDHHLFGNNRVIMVSDGAYVINWTAPANVTITSAIWLGNATDSHGGTKEVFRVKADSFEQPSTTTDSNDESSPPSTNPAEGEERARELKPEHADANMYIELMWTSGDQSRTTTSGVFAVFNGSVPSSGYDDVVQRIDKLIRGDNAGVQINGSEVSSDSVSPADTVSAKTSALPSSTAGGGGASIPTIDSGDGGSSTSTSSSRAGPSLSPGAIAGIVIGSVLGLSLVVFLVWFFLRRRRRADHVSDGAYGSGHNPHEYLADKEAHARVTESPHSPYSDDGQQPRQLPEQSHHLQAEGPGAAVTAAERSPLTPYGEEEHAPIAASSMEDMARSGIPSPTPNVTTNVSHLIEDGMTEEEIRRLEDEERALDDAIEQAGQGQGRSRKP